MADQQEPGWKRAGRNGPLDWWLGCQQHGYAYQRGCMSCSMAEDHNIEFQQKLDRERNAGVAASPATEEWNEASRIRDLPEVDEAIRNMLEDQTGDNSTCMVRAVMRAAGVTLAHEPKDKNNG